MVKTLILLEDPKKIDRIIQDGPKIGEQFVYISLSPCVSYTFEKLNIPYKSIRNFGDGEALYQQGLENFQRSDRIVTILDKELEHLHNISTLKPARYSIVYLKPLLDTLWIEIYSLKKIIEIEQPDFIRFYAKPQNKLKTPLYILDDSFYSQILKIPGWNVPIEIIQETKPNSPEQRIMCQKNTTFSHLLNWIKYNNILYDFSLILKKEGILSIAAAFYYFITCWHRNPVIIYNSGYNWDDSLVELYRRGILPVYRIRDETFKKFILKENNYWEEILKVCNNHPGMREFDQILGIDVSALFFKWLSHIIGRSIQESITVYPLARGIIHKKKIRCLLHSSCILAIDYAIVQAAHDAGIPVISWQHGGAGYCFHPMMPFFEFINSDWHFVFGEGVAASYCSTSKSIGLNKIPNFVPVGSSSLDIFHRNGKKSGIKQAQKPVVYISTSYTRNIYTMSQPCNPLNWDETLWRIQKQIINLAKKNPDKEFIIKLHPSHKNKEPPLSYMTDHGIKNVKIITSEMTIRELTNIADVVIFDLLSTGILQVLTSDLPVFLYTGLHEIDKNTVLQLKKRAYVYESSGEFIRALDEYIHTRKVTDYTIDTTNSDFIMRFGNDIYNNRSAERAVKKLNEILSGLHNVL